MSSPTHRAGHLLDVFLTRTDCTVKTLDVEPPVLSDHSFITVSVDLQFSHGSLVNTVRRRNWRQFSYADFCDDLSQSALLRNPPTDAASLFTCYHETLLALVDQHAPFADTRIHAHPNGPWYDGRCRVVKMKTRKLERAYRRDKSENSYQVWRQQSTFMRHYFQQRYTVYWRSSISDNMNDPKALWSKISALLDAPQAPSSATTHTADAFANHFQSKVSVIRNSTSSAPYPRIDPLPSETLQRLREVIIDEVTKVVGTDIPMRRVASYTIVAKRLDG